MILVIDNHDSFTFNLVQLLRSCYEDVQVIYNDQKNIEEILDLNPQGILLSPGPCTPKEAGVCMDVVKTFYDKVPILGICLGHQSICCAFGGKLKVAEHLMHGKVDEIVHNHLGLLKGLPESFKATRYHSLIVEACTLPDVFDVTSHAVSDHYIMGIKHKDFPVEGLQFHPESYRTEHGKTIIDNFVKEVKRYAP